jgi:hypothetical protein
VAGCSISAAECDDTGRHTVGGVEWVAEVWVDPQWHAARGGGRPHPTPGVPVVLPLDASTVQVDGSALRLTRDGARWSASAAGSGDEVFVGTVGEPLPTVALRAGAACEVGIGSRMYVGDWTRVTIRPAVPQDAASPGEIVMSRNDRSHPAGQSLVGAVGVVHTRIRDGGRAGEVRIVVDGLPHYYLAFSAAAVDVGTEVVVINNRGGRAVDVEPHGRPGELPEEEERS